MSPLSILLIGAALAAALFILTWRLSLRLDNFSFVDVAWALAFTPVAGLYAALGSGWMPRRLVIAALVVAWSIRLGTHLWRRVARHHPAEDARYRVLRQRWSGSLASKFLGFFLGQALLVWLLTLPVFLVCRNDAIGFHPLEIAGFALWFIGLAGEGIADRQLERFKAASRGNPLALCREGLWSWSRHPNYFFQSLLWWGLFLAALPAAWGWTALLAPIAMLFFLLKITGIPLTEELALEKRGDLYRDYQRTVSAFIPMPPGGRGGK
jgi:steroid 5-alpha reductase family enzyme